MSGIDVSSINIYSSIDVSGPNYPRIFSDKAKRIFVRLGTSIRGRIKISKEVDGTIQEEELWNDEIGKFYLELQENNSPTTTQILLARGRDTSSQWEEPKRIEKMIDFEIKLASIDNGIISVDDDMVDPWKHERSISVEFRRLGVAMQPLQPSQLIATFKEPFLKAQVGQQVLLDGSQSSGDNIATWSITQDPTDLSRVTLQDVGPAKKYSKQFTFPNTNEILDFKLLIRDSAGNSASDRVSVQKQTSGPGDVFDAFGMKILQKVTSRKVKIETVSHHRNGDRFNVNHKFENHMMQGYYKLASNQKKIETKEDGPNHGGCTFTDDQICFWIELGIDLASGDAESQYEWPHNDNYPIPDEKNDVLESVGRLRLGNWVGWATACYWGEDGLRHYKAWCDPKPFPNNDATQRPLNNWKLIVHLRHTADLIKDPKPIIIPRKMSKVINYRNGFECEVRMHAGAKTRDADFKNAWIFELEPIQTLFLFDF